MKERVLDLVFILRGPAIEAIVAMRFEVQLVDRQFGVIAVVSSVVVIVLIQISTSCEVVIVEVNVFRAKLFTPWFWHGDFDIDRGDESDQLVTANHFEVIERSVVQVNALFQNWHPFVAWEGIELGFRGV